MYKAASRNMQRRAERDKPEQSRKKLKGKLRRRIAKMRADALAVKNGTLSFDTYVYRYGVNPPTIRAPSPSRRQAKFHLSH
jgi:hypothetical protein